MRNGKATIAAMMVCVLVVPACDKLGLGDGTGGMGGGADALAEVDPQTMAQASLKASALSYYLAGLVASSGVDLSTVDQATLDELVASSAPEAQSAVDAWLASVDPSTIALAAVQPKAACTEKHGCPYGRKCVNDPYKSLTHHCWVVDCGSAACGGCPDWFPNLIKAPVLKSWCAYVCVDLNSPGTVVAVGVGGVTIFGNAYPGGGAYCFAP